MIEKILMVIAGVVVLIGLIGLVASCFSSGDDEWHRMRDWHD